MGTVTGGRIRVSFLNKMAICDAALLVQVPSRLARDARTDAGPA